MPFADGKGQCAAFSVLMMPFMPGMWRMHG
jgi:hypothetical protein